MISCGLDRRTYEFAFRPFLGSINDPTATLRWSYQIINKRVKTRWMGHTPHPKSNVRSGGRFLKAGIVDTLSSATHLRNSASNASLHIHHCINEALNERCEFNLQLKYTPIIRNWVRCLVRAISMVSVPIFNLKLGLFCPLLSFCIIVISECSRCARTRGCDKSRCRARPRYGYQGCCRMARKALTRS